MTKLNEAPATLRSGYLLPSFVGSGIPPKRNPSLKSASLRSRCSAKWDKIFIDTSAFVAIWNDLDSTHKKALKLLKEIEKVNPIILTSSDVIGESLTVISRRIGKIKAKEFLNQVIKQRIKVIFIDEITHKDTRDFFFRVKSKNISFIDCSSAVAMKRNKIKVIFSFDEDFKNMGVRLLGDELEIN